MLQEAACEEGDSQPERVAPDGEHAPAPVSFLAAIATATLAGCGVESATSSSPPDGIAAVLEGRSVRRLAVDNQTIDTAPRAVRVPDATALMDWAERQYAAYFPATQSNIVASPYIYRHYPSTGNYLGVAGHDVYILGAVSGGTLIMVGTLADFAPHVFPAQVPGSDIDAARFLHQAQFASTDEDLGNVKARGYGGWLHDQYTMAPGQSGVEWLDAGGFGTVDLEIRSFFEPRLASRMAWSQLFSRRDRLRTRIGLALSEYFVVSSMGVDSVDSWVVNYGMAAYWDLLTGHAFGNFRNLLEAVTLSPVMGRYLNTLKNLKEDPATGRQPDENYAREVMQLFTIGLVELNLDGTEKRDAAGKRIETYSLSDVTGLARVFTGYEMDYRQNRPFAVPLEISSFGQLTDTKVCQLPMRLIAENHSMLEARFLGATVPANTDGGQALKVALDTLFNHANVGPFFCKQMIQRLVTSNPAPAYVARVASAFNDNGYGVRGDLQAVFTAILLDHDARDAALAARSGFGKLREPIVRIVQWAHTFGDEATLKRWYLEGAVGDATILGQSPFRAPSVFNFFRPDFVPPATELAMSGAPAPEFQIANETTNAFYVNFLQDIALWGVMVRQHERAFNAAGEYAEPPMDFVVAPYRKEFELIENPAALVARLNLLLAAGRLSEDTEKMIASALGVILLPAKGGEIYERECRKRMAAAVVTVMCTPEYLVQK